MTGTKGRRGGWPKRKPAPGERVPLSFRLTPESKGRIDRAAAASGRSISQEVELRIDLSFRDIDAFDRAIEIGHGRQIAGLLMLFGRVMRDVGAHAAHRSTGTVDSNWLTDPFAFDQ